ncbi:MAG TPA: DinB family protein [Ktedonobacterales bacterium]|nr:DinB family protein [Ktedonobacterales bacterium]
MAKDFTLVTFYDLWREYFDHIREAITPLTAKQVALRSAPGQRSIGEIVAHIIAGRAFWLGDFIGEIGEELDALHRWNDPGALTTDVAALVSGLDRSWRYVANLLDRWTPDDMRQTFPHDWRGNHYELSRSWVVWNVLKHDLHHGGELSLALGLQGLQAPDI